MDQTKKTKNKTINLWSDDQLKCQEHTVGKGQSLQ